MIGSSLFSRFQRGNEALTANRISVRIHQRQRKIWIIVLALLLVCIGLVGAGWWVKEDLVSAQMSTQRLVALEAQLKQLETERAQHLTELEMERATRRALEKQLASLAEEIRQLKEELSFFKTTAAQTRPAAGKKK